MILTILKWAVPVILMILLAAAALTKKTFHVETVIPVSPAAVWAVLIDTQSYPEWNPVFVAVEGELRSGATVKNLVRFPDGSTVDMSATIKGFEEGRELRQYGGTWGLMTFDHQWLLEPVEGGTRVIQHEVDRGLILWTWNSDWIEPAYQSVLDALAKRVAETQDG
ncbi:hypothetical protein GS636_06385 [Ruegeria sp. HKCCD4884]|uniref:SRPBCC domain-containing protein n=1 Tax=Ruegeria sp. HKCCD4884 TaxID=2683022 RepID=UPI0014918BC2|nr:SRPBCC domain-containing protein [Ruegeria sp. HKCCD4884]NOD92410.1 hypothetical protein [Ruegeria sp. HKCCD4884]